MIATNNFPSIRRKAILTIWCLIAAAAVLPGKAGADPPAGTDAKPQESSVRGLQESAEELYKPKYLTFAHLTLAYEATTEGIKPNYKLLDDIIDQVKSRIKERPQYSRKEALDILRSIHEVLVSRNFVYIHKSHLLSDALRPRKLDEQTREYIRNFKPTTDVKKWLGKQSNWGKLFLSPSRKRHALAHLDEPFHFYNCDTITVIYLGIGDALGLPLREVRDKEHRFIRWHFPDGRYLNWEATGGFSPTDEQVRSSLNVPEQAISSGASLRSVSRTELLSDIPARSLYASDKTKDPDRAIADFTKAIKLSPSNAKLYIDRGLAWQQKGKRDKAIADYTKAIQLNPRYSRAYHFRGLAWAFKGDLKKAIADYTKAIELDPKDACDYYNRGAAWLQKGDFDKAIADYSKAIELEPKWVLAYNNRGVVWKEKGNLDRAITDYNKAIQLDPRCVLAYCNRGVAWHKKGDMDKAIADYNKAIALDPTDADAYSNRALAWKKKGDMDRSIADSSYARALAWGLNGEWDKAIADYSRTIEQNPKNPYLFLVRSKMWRNKGDLVKAIADLDRTIELDPKNVEAYRWRGEFWFSQLKLDKTIADFTKAIELAPKNVGLYQRRGNVWRIQGESDKAIADLTKAIELAPKNSWNYTVRALAWMAKREPDKAIADYTRAIDLTTDKGYLVKLYRLRSRAWLLKGDIEKCVDDYVTGPARLLELPKVAVHSLRGQIFRDYFSMYEKALACFDDALKLKPRSAMIHVEIGRTYLKSGDYDKAIRNLDRAIAIKPHKEAYCSRGEARWKKGQVDKALADVNQALERDPKYAKAYFIRCYIRAGQGNLETAIADMSTVIELRPTFGRAYAARGCLYYMSGETDKAVADFDEGIRRSPRDSRLYCARANAWRRKGNLDRAFEDCNEAIKANPKNAWAYEIRAGAWMTKREPDKAIADYTKAIELEPSECSNYVHRGIVWIAIKRDREKSQADFMKARQINPKRTIKMLNRWRAEIRKHRGERPTSRPAFRRSQSARRELFDIRTLKTGGDYAKYVNQGIALAKEGKFEAAIKQFNMAVETEPKRHEAYAALGVAWKEKGNLDKAIVNLGRAIELGPKMPTRADLSKPTADRRKLMEQAGKMVPAINSLVWIYVSEPEHRNPKEARRLALILFRLARRNPACLDTVACAFAENGDFARAVAIEKMAVRLAKDDDAKKGFQEMVEVFEKKMTYIEYQQSKAKSNK